MVCVDVCGFCKHYKGKIDGWLPYCEAFPDGWPRGFSSTPEDKCTPGISFELNENLPDHDIELFRRVFEKK